MFSISRYTRLLKLNRNSIPLSTYSPISQTLKPLNSRITFYMRNGLVDQAHNLFDEMPHKNTVTWNSMIRGYFLNEQSQKALTLFDLMPDRDLYTYNTLISGFIQCGDINRALAVFDGMSFRDVVSWNSIIAGYFQVGFVDEAMGMFGRMPLEMKDVISWNLVLGGLLKNQQVELAKECFRHMGIRDSVSWSTMISGLARVGQMMEAREVFDEMPVKDIRAWNALVFGYIQNQQVDEAEILFRRSPERDVDSWRHIINGLLSHQRVNDAFRLFMEMPLKCQKTWNNLLLEVIRNGNVKAAHGFVEKLPYGNIVSWTNTLVGYFGIGEVSTAVQLFKLLPAPDTTVWNVMICGLGENGHGEEGLKLFLTMKELGLSANKSTITSVLTICSDLSASHLGGQIHAEAMKTGFHNITAVSNAMVTMYSRCGNLHSALQEFSSMPNRNIISWNSIICGFAHHGFGEKAIEMFEKMRLADVKPNHITFVGVLSACSHAGLVDQGRYYFDYMINKCHLQPTDEHYTCLIDLLGRFGLLDVAMAFLHQIREDRNEIPESVWGALLGASRIHKNIAVAEIAGEKLLEIEPTKSGIYLILAEVYQSVGRREEAEKILSRMSKKGVKKQPGCSWIEVNNNWHVFLSGDSSHRELNRICSVLDLIRKDIDNMILKCSTSLLEQPRLLLDVP
ncbi:Pentatricopeptide repeat (PPR) superfamily protein [Euphorbia peplus]|nr:Pentatricopeptide repeat (PPR) superfamily protein [Euphorbia peplus]